MKISSKLMLKLMKEEYDKRVEYHLKEIETKDKKRNINLVQDAKGLKVRNKQGLELTIEDFQVIDNVEYIVLRPPEMARSGVEEEMDIQEPQSSADSLSSLIDSEGESMELQADGIFEDENGGVRGDLRSKSSKMDYKRTFKDFDANYNSLENSDIRDGLVYVKITDFEKEYSL